MTQEEKDLLYKDLCARIPYSLIVACTDDDGTMPNVWEVVYINKFKDAYLLNTESTATQLISIEEVKPYLFPISSMTSDQKREYARIVVMSGNIATSQLIGMTVQDWFSKNHIDYRGLIDKGLAIDATNKNIY